MPLVKFVTVVSVSMLILVSGKSQFTDSSTVNTYKAYGDSLKKVDWQSAKLTNRFPIKSFLVPAALITYGVTALNSEGLKKWNNNIKEEVYLEHPHQKFQIDNFLQFAPALTVYGLNAMGVKGKHNFRDRSMIYLMSNVILNTTVFTIKKFSNQVRPDGSNNYSFPSGHTAVAFASAEFMRQEYKDVSPWYGVAGYTMAAATGYLRMYNNKHWLSDVAAGAGIGIASTRLSYWIYPMIQRRIFKDKPVNTIIIPSYQDKVFSVGMVHRF
jgi:membrane-associated phospholipid phosphatase